MHSTGGDAPAFHANTLRPMIKKVNGKYVVLSETTGRVFGTYATLAEAKRRLRQIEFFKHRQTGKKK